MSSSIDQSAKTLMNIPAGQPAPEFFGLYELEPDGTVRHFLLRRKNSLINVTSQPDGVNFFENVADFENCEELRSRFLQFIDGSLPAESITFDCRYGIKTVPVRIMMLRAYQESCLEPARIIILDIRKSFSEQYN